MYISMLAPPPGYAGILPATRLQDAQSIALKGQHHSAQGNALGYISPQKLRPEGAASFFPEICESSLTAAAGYAGILPAMRLQDAQTIALKGQHHSAQGNALGYISPQKLRPEGAASFFREICESSLTAATRVRRHPACDASERRANHPPLPHYPCSPTISSYTTYYPCRTNIPLEKKAKPSKVSYNGSTYSVTSIGRQAFYDCTGLTSIEIPNSITSIDTEAFYYCTYNKGDM